jgi:hypothetical protein
MKKLIIFVTALAILTSCENLTELNTDVKNPQEVPGGALFANATVELFDFLASTNVNENNFRLWSQQWTQTTYTDESNYDVVSRNTTGDMWDLMYTRVARDAREAKKFIDADQFISSEDKVQQKAACEILEIMAMMYMVDAFGDVPYSEAFTDDVTPKYDDDASIYSDLASRLETAMTDLGSGDMGFGSFDIIYGGEAERWQMLANSLKLRMAIRMADADPATAQGMAEAAASKVFMSSDDDYKLAYQGTTPNTNPLWEDLVQSGRSDFVACATLVDILKDLNDPRIDNFYQDQYEITDSMGNTTVEYLGGPYGGGANAYNALSHAGEMQVDPTHPGFILTYTEVRFLLADATSRGWDVGGTPEAHYEAAITNSILEWGGTEQEALDYLAQDAVAWATAEGDWKQKIGTQKWIAMYDQGFEAWTSYRMYDAPEFVIAEGNPIPTPVRYTYPVTEYSLNENSVATAAEAMGGDEFSSPVFWDQN